MSARTATPDTTRIVRYLREHPNSSIMEIRFALFISNVTARMSDCRKDGIAFTKFRDPRGVWRYSIAEGQTTLGLSA